MRLLQRIVTWFAALDAARRTRLVLGLLIAVVAAVGVSIWSSQESYAPIVSGQGYDAALAAAAAVDQAGIPYRLTPPDALEVPVRRLGAARAAVAADMHLPGLAEVSELELGLTPQAQEWAFLRAAEGNLARMLNGIEGIGASQVHVVPTEESIYVGEKRPATASVFVKLKPTAELSPSQVRAITNLVANSVNGLTPDRVSVGDDRGNLLASGDGGASEDGPLGAARSLVAYRKEIESRYERAIVQALLPVVGYGGGMSVTATIDLDLTSSETTTRQLETTRQAVISEVTEETQTSKSSPAGVPGVDANLPERAAEPARGGSESQRAATTVNYAYPTVDEIARRPAGGVKRLSIAVQVDDKRIEALVAASNGRIESETLRKQIDTAVEAAVGFDAARGDRVAVSYLPFVEVDWTEGSLPESSVRGILLDVLPYATGILALVLVFAFVVRPIVAAASVERPAVAFIAPPREPVLIPDGHGGYVAAPVDPDADLAHRLKALVDNFQPVDPRELNRLVDRQSENAADVLRKWARVR